MSYVQSVASAVPKRIVPQMEVREFASKVFADSSLELEKYLPVFENSKIINRPVLMDIDWYAENKTFKEKNDLFLENALVLAEESSRKAINRAGLTPEDIDIIIIVTSSGFVVPTLDARLIDILGLSIDVKRIPIVGLGCAGGAHGLARARELSVLYPDKNILLTAVETCTLTFRPSDKRKANFIALSLFSDGAASVIISGKEKKGSIRLVSDASRKWRDSLDVMGWEVEMDGLQVVFDRSIPGLISKYFRDFYVKFLGMNSSSIENIRHYLLHPGGAKVLEAFSRAIEIPESIFKHSMKILQSFGNLSSPTILMVIEDFFNGESFPSGEKGILSAMGPGFTCELLLFETT